MSPELAELVRKTELARRAALRERGAGFARDSELDVRAMIRAKWKPVHLWAAVAAWAPK